MISCWAHPNRAPRRDFFSRDPSCRPSCAVPPPYLARPPPPYLDAASPPPYLDAAPPPYLDAAPPPYLDAAPPPYISGPAALP
ncbi:unnamed protein product [Closterium sp. NIES-54]